MRCLHITPHFYPATHYGGPIYSGHGLCNALAEIAGVELRVLTTDGAGAVLRERVPVASFPMRYAAGYDVYFCRRLFGADVSASLLWRLARMVRWADVVHITSVYSFPTIPALFACRMLGKPIVWSPRGALQRWKKAGRPALKYAWELVCRSFLDPSKCALHVTSEPEAKDSNRRIPGVKIVQIPNGVDIPDLPERPPRDARGRLRLLFMGRLHPIKGIENLFHAVAKVDPETVSLVLYGDGEPDYKKHLEMLAATLGLGRSVRFAGHVEGVAKSRAFAEADVCMVPSHSENFGLVIAEALASGMPVVASTGTPWPDVEKRGCGLWVNNEPDSLAAAITSLRDRDLATMGASGRAWMEKAFGWSAIGHRMAAVYAELRDGADER